MSNQTAVIVNLIRDAFPKTRAKVGIFFQSDADVLEQLLLEPHAIAVFGESFHPLNRARRKAERNNGGKLRENLLFAETDFIASPVAARSLDALILLGGLPQCDKTPLSTLMYLRSVLGPQGLIIWPQPLEEGILAALASLKYPSSGRRLGATSRTALTRLMMGAGFVEIGQVAAQRKPIVWTVTFGRAPMRPWE